MCSAPRIWEVEDIGMALVYKAATCVGMVMWEWCCVTAATLYVYFVDQCHPYIFWISFLYYNYTVLQFLCRVPVRVMQFNWNVGEGSCFYNYVYLYSIGSRIIALIDALC